MKIILQALLFSACAALAQQAGSQPYPSKPIRMIVGYTAGSGADALARLVAAQLTAHLGQQVYVENRPGAGTTIAASGAAHLPADGHTLFFADTALLIAPNIYAKLNFDPVKSFTPVAGVATAPLAIVVNPNVKATTIAELVTLLKADPGRQAYGSPGIGSVQHLAMELFKREAGVSIVHIPYKWAGAIVPDIVSGQIPIGIIGAPLALEQAEEETLRPLAFTNRLLGFDASPRLFIVAPAGTPEGAVSQLNAALKKILSAKDLQQGFAAQGATADWTTPEDLAARMAQDIQRWAEIARHAGMKAE